MFGFVCFVLVFQSALCATKQPPNIIVVVIDDLGWDDVSLHGSDQVPTPNIDRLAAEGRSTTTLEHWTEPEGLQHKIS